MWNLWLLNPLLSYFAYFFCMWYFLSIGRTFFAQIFRKAICFDFKFNFPNKLRHFCLFLLSILVGLFDMQDRPLACVHKHINRILRRLFVLRGPVFMPFFHFFLSIIYWVVFDFSFAIVILWKSIKSFVWHCAMRVWVISCFFGLLHLPHSRLISIEKVLWLRCFVAFTYLMFLFYLLSFGWVCVCVR